MKLTDPGSIVFNVSLLTSMSIRFAPLLRLPARTTHRKPFEPLVHLLGTHKFWSPPCLSERHPKERRSRKTKPATSWPSTALCAWHCAPGCTALGRDFAWGATLRTPGLLRIGHPSANPCTAS